MTKKTDLPDRLVADLKAKSPEFSDLLLRISRVAEAIFHHGWAEANAGNLSIDITEIVKKYYPASVSTNRFFLVSKTGSRFRQMMHDPDSGLMIIELGSADKFFGANDLPTSEWPCHKAMHLADKDSQYPCLLHSHSTEIIALCSTPLIHDPSMLNATLANFLPELGIYLPKGIAIAAKAPPGSSKLAECSVAAIGERQILIWPGHGLLCRAGDINTALDYMEIVNKAAKIYFLSCNLN